jgi:hypothetical protein
MAISLAACTSGGSGTAQSTVTVTAPASTAPAPGPSTSSSASAAAARPGILAVTKNGALVRIDPTTGSVQQTLVASGVLGDEISVSPDQSTVYYAQRSGCDTEVKSMSTGGGAVTSIAPGQLPAVSPDGTKLAFAQEPLLTADCMPHQSTLAILFKVVIRTVATGADTVLSAPPPLQSSGLFAPISHLSWAADNTRLAVSVSSVEDNEGWSVNIVDTSAAQYYVPPEPGVTFVPVTGSPDAQRSYIREGIFLPDGNLFISRACCGGVPIQNTSRLMWEVTQGGALVHEVAIGYPNLEHLSLAAAPTGQFLLYIAGSDLYVAENGGRPSKLTSGMIAATWM